MLFCGKVAPWSYLTQNYYSKNMEVKNIFDRVSTNRTQFSVKAYIRSKFQDLTKFCHFFFFKCWWRSSTCENKFLWNARDNKCRLKRYKMNFESSIHFWLVVYIKSKTNSIVFYFLSKNSLVATSITFW